MATTDSSLRRIADALEPRVEDMVAEMVERARAELPGLAGVSDPALLESVAAAARSQLRIGLELVARGELPEALPHEAIEEARLSAQAGLTVSDITKSYRIAHEVMLEHLLRGVEAGPDAAELLVAGSRALFAHIDRATTLVTEAFTRERDRLLRTREQRRLALVRELLDGGGRASDVSADLGWDLAGTHVAVVGWGPGCAEAVTDLAAGARSLVVGVTDQSVWAWLDADPASSDRSTPGNGSGNGPLAGARPGDGSGAPGGAGATGGAGAAGGAAGGGARAGLALGDALAGPDGFRRSHFQARRAAWVGARRGDALVRYGDVAIEALAGADDAAVREFVERELGPFAAEGSEREQALRDTLAAWLSCGHNAAAAGAALGVHERTVAYRLRTVEERLGRPVGARGVELGVALRLRALLGG